MEPINAPFDVLPDSLPSSAVVPKPTLLLHSPSEHEFNLAALNSLPKNAAGLQSYSEFVKAARQSEVRGGVAKQPVDDRSKSISICGHSFRFVGVPISESECSYQSDVTSSSGQGAEDSHRGDGAQEQEVSAPVPAWTPTASPAKSILRRSSVAPLQPPQPSLKPLVYDYASSASPASRRMSTVSLCASSKRASAQRRRLSFDTGVQVRIPDEHTEDDYRQATVSARKVRSRRSSMSSRRMSSASSCRPATYAGFEPFGLSDAGALLCETEGRKFLLVVDDVEAEETVGTQCQPLDIDVEMDLLFEKLDEAGEEENDSVMEVEQVRSAAVLPASQHVPHGNLSCTNTAAENAKAHVVPHSIPLISLTDLPATPGPSTAPSARRSEAPSETHNTPPKTEAEAGTSPVECRTPNATQKCSLSRERETSCEVRNSEGTRSGVSPMYISGPNERNRATDVEDDELETGQSNSSPQQRDASPIESSDHGEFIATRDEVRADAALITGIDLEDEDEIVVATTAHATRTRSSRAPSLASGQVLVPSPNTVGNEKIPDVCVDSNQVLLPQVDNDLVVEIFEEPEIAESEVLASVPSQPTHQPQEPNANELCNYAATHADKEEVTNVGAVLDKEPDTSGIDNIMCQEAAEVADSVMTEQPRVPDAKSDSSTQITAPSSVARNVGFAAQASAAISIAPISDHVKNGEECPERELKRMEAGNVTKSREVINPKENSIRLQTNVSQVNIEPQVTAYQLAILETLTPNTKATLARIRGSKGPFAVQGVQVSPLNSATTHRLRRRVVSGDIRNVSKHERGTSITRSARDHDSNRAESEMQLEQPTRKDQCNGNERPESTRLRDETSERWMQVSGTHFTSEAHNENTGHCTEGSEKVISSPEPRQPEMLLRASTGPAAVTPSEYMQPNMTLGEAEELFEDVIQLHDAELPSNVDFAGLMSPAPLAKRRHLNENEIIDVDAEESEQSLQVVAVEKIESLADPECAQTRSGSSEVPNPVEDIPPVRNENKSQDQPTVSKKDSSVINSLPTMTISNPGEAYAQPSNGDDCEDYDEVEDHGDEGFEIDHVADVEQDGSHRNEEKEINNVVDPSEAHSHRSKQIVAPASRKRPAPGDVLSSETMDAPLRRSDRKEDDSQPHSTQSSPPPAENSSSVTSSPVIRKRSRRLSKRKKVSNKAEISKNKKKRQWRELSHLPIDNVRIDEGPGPRRSKRQRFPRLKYWKNEVVSYERRRSQMMPTVSEVLVDVGDTDSEEAWMPRR